MEQNQSSAPWLHPPNTLCNTDGWRRTRKSTSKITVRSAKKQERLKKTWNAKPKSYWVWPRDALAPFPPDPWSDHTDRPLCCLPGLFPPPRLPHPLSPPCRSEGSSNQSVTRWPVRVGWGRRGGGVWRSRATCVCVCPGLKAESAAAALRGTWAQTRRLGYYHGSSGNVCGTVPLLFFFFFFFFTPQSAWNLIISKMLLTWDSDGMFWSVFLRKWDETGGRGRLRRLPSKNPLLY